MTEEEYADLSDLQIARCIEDMIRQLNCFDEVNNPHKRVIASAARTITLDLERRIEGHMERG